MPLIVPCECGREFQVGEHMAGRKIRCKHCGAIVAVPAAASGLADEFDGSGGELDAAGEPVFDAAPPPRKGRRGLGQGLSPAVRYSIAGGIAVVTIGIVIGILYARGVIGGNVDIPAGEDDQFTANPKFTSKMSRRAAPPATIEFLQSTQVKSAVPHEIPLRYWLSVTGVANRFVSGNVDATGNAQTVLVQPAASFKTRDDARDPMAAVHRATVQTNLKLIGLAFHEYYVKHNRFPAPYRKRQGLSWRVHLLPFLGQQSLYEKFKLDEPWDSARNRKLISQMPAVFATPGSPVAGKTTTHVFVGSGTPFGEPPRTFECRIDYRVAGQIDPDDEYELRMSFADRRVLRNDRVLWPEVTRTISGRDLQAKGSLTWKLQPWEEDKSNLGFRDIWDGVDSTLLAVAAGPETAMEWTKPGGLLFDSVDPFRVVGTVPASGLPIVAFNGKVHFVPPSVSAIVFRALITHQGREEIAL